MKRVEFRSKVKPNCYLNLLSPICVEKYKKQTVKREWKHALKHTCACYMHMHMYMCMCVKSPPLS